MFNTLRPRQDGRHFADDSFTCIFFNENCCVLFKISLIYVRKGPIDNIRALVQIMAWRRSGDKPLSEPMMISLPTHICVTWPQWVNVISQNIRGLILHALTGTGLAVVNLMVAIYFHVLPKPGSYVLMIWYANLVFPLLQFMLMTEAFAV